MTLPLRIAIYSLPLLLAVSGAAQTQAQRDDRIKTVDWEKPFRHELTGIIMPSELEGFEIYQISDYEDFNGVKGHVSLRYENDSVKMDVYFSSPDVGQAEEDGDPLALHKANIGAALGAVQEAADRGYYEDLSISDEASVESFGGDQNLTMVSTVFTLRDHRNLDLPEDDRPLKESGIAIVMYADWQLKTRWTFALDEEDEKANEANRASVQNFLNRYSGLIAEAAIRPDVLKLAESLRSDPTNQEAMGPVVGFAEESQLVRITIDPKYLPIEELENEDSLDPSPATCLLAAFVAGNLLEQYRTLEFESQDVAGAVFLTDAYEVLRKEDKCPPIPKIDAWIEARKAGKLEEAIEEGE